MQDISELGEVISKREFTVQKTGEIVFALVGKPRPQDAGDGWVCPYQIRRGKSKTTGYAWGVDSLQAMQLVSEVLRAALEELNLSLEFLGNTNWRSFFPISIGDFGEQSLRERMEAALVDEQSRWLREKLEERTTRTKPEGK